MTSAIFYIRNFRSTASAVLFTYMLAPGAQISPVSLPIVEGGYFIEETKGGRRLAKSKKKKAKLTDKQRRFVDEYVKTGNATQAAINAGYSKHTAASCGAITLAKEHVRAAIDRRMDKMHDKNVADAEEVLRYLTSVLRGESQAEEIVIEGQGNGFSEARAFSKKPSEDERLKAARLLATRFGLNITALEFKNKMEKMELENQKLRLEVERLRGGSEGDMDDGFLKALGVSAAEVWSDEE